MDLIVMGDGIGDQRTLKKIAIIMNQIYELVVMPIQQYKRYRVIITLYTLLLYVLTLYLYQVRAILCIGLSLAMCVFSVYEVQKSRYSDLLEWIIKCVGISHIVWILSCIPFRKAPLFVLITFAIFSLIAIHYLTYRIMQRKSSVIVYNYINSQALALDEEIEKACRES